MQGNEVYWAAQILGGIAMLMGWWASAQQQDSRLLTGNLAAACATALHLALLGSPLGMATQMLSALRFGLARRGPSVRLALIFALGAALQGLLLAQHWSEWCAVAAAMLSSLLLFTVQGERLRWGLLICSGLNLIFALSLGSLSGMLYHTVAIGLLSRQLILELKRHFPAYTVQ
ncbi:YgjV family protein [Ferrimonas balearica]|uniref:YgjV family protein n=1 Tax=Ferrimonas balearica TaxID=44012 RepID=UPI001C99E073|nr:YgjV family protein [Ferrimonas balearica]MBY5920531.1 YgjV family protein [Ferrimonas balearica]MBY5996784.1 YgjV family protein [Ferrimonas balearica]